MAQSKATVIRSTAKLSYYAIMQKRLKRLWFLVTAHVKLLYSTQGFVNGEELAVEVLSTWRLAGWTSMKNESHNI